MNETCYCQSMNSHPAAPSGVTLCANLGIKSKNTKHGPNMNTSAQTPERQRKPRDKAKRKGEIIESAANCFMEQGYHATTIDDVARRLGTTKGHIYHYYSSKTDLFFDVHRVGMGYLFTALEPALATKGSAAEMLEAMLLAHANAMLQFHTFETVVAQGVQIHRFGATTPDQRRVVRELMDDRDRFEAHFKTCIQNGIREGSLRDSDVSVTTKMLLGALQWSIFWYRPGKSDTAQARAQLAAKMVAPLMSGLLA